MAQLGLLTLKDRVERLDQREQADLGERRQVPFPELLLNGMSSRIDVVVTFLAMLEMARLRLLRIYQSTEGELYLEARFDSAEHAFERLAGIDTTLDGAVPPARNESP